MEVKFELGLSNLSSAFCPRTMIISLPTKEFKSHEWINLAK